MLSPLYAAQLQLLSQQRRPLQLQLVLLLVVLLAVLFTAALLHAMLTLNVSSGRTAAVYSLAGQYSVLLLLHGLPLLLLLSS